MPAVGGSREEGAGLAVAAGLKPEPRPATQIRRARVGPIDNSGPAPPRSPSPPT
jgi:hypothetical protein